MELQAIDVIKKIEAWIPEKYALSDDRIGLITGSFQNPVKNILVTLDVNERVVDEALSLRADFIFAHHNPFFETQSHFTADSPKGKILHKLIKNDISLYVAHTNLDAAFGGVNDVLSDMLGLGNVLPLSVQWKERYIKFAVTVPMKFEEIVRKAIIEAGAGHMGNYSDVSFHSKGIGHFMPGQGTEPFLGEIDELSIVTEAKIETIVSTENLDQVIKAMTDAHPYEEIAYDIIPLYNEGKKNGPGRIGYLKDPITLGEFIDIAAEVLETEKIVFSGDLQRHVYKVAICGGSGMSFYKEAIQKGADVFLTGDLKYHDAQSAAMYGLAVVDAGHYATEKPVVEKVANFLRLNFKDHVSVITSKINTDPLAIYRR